jgi:quinol monooxygenase YgiN
MITTIARWYVADGQVPHALSALQSLVEQIQQTEPETLIYLVHQPAAPTWPPAPATEILFFEAYSDIDALNHHLERWEEFLRQNPELFIPDANNNPFFLAESLTRIAGFIRPSAYGAEQRSIMGG